MSRFVRAALAALGWLFSASVWTAAPADKDSQPYSAEDFVREPSLRDMELSPGGEYLAVTHRLSSKNKFGLFILKLPERKVVGELKFSGDDSVGRVIWASDSRVVVQVDYLEEDSDDVPVWTGELFAMDFDGGRKRYLTGARSNKGNNLFRNEADYEPAVPIRSLPKDPAGLLVMINVGSHDVLNGRFRANLGDGFGGLYRLDIYDGRLKKLVDSPIRQPRSYFADADGRPRLVMGFHDDSAERQFFWKDEQHDWRRLPLPGAQIYPLRVAEDGSRVYVQRDKPGATETRCLVEVPIPLSDPADMQELVCMAISGSGRFFFDQQGIPYGYQVSEADPILLIEGKTPEPLAGVFASLQEQFEGQSVFLLSRSKNGDRGLFEISGDRYPGEYLLYDRKTQQAVYIDSERSWLDPSRLAEVKTIHYKARDGLVIEGYMTLPPGPVKGPLPTVVMPHGGPTGVRDQRGWDTQAQFLASRGYLVLQMNYRGSGGYGAQFEAAGYGEWAGKIIDDITDGTRWAIQAGHADPKRVCIFGARYGGYATLMSLVREPELYRCGIAMSGVYDLKALFEDSDATLLQSGRLYWEKSMAPTPEQRAKQSPIQYLDRLRAPVFIIHGGMDIRAPENQAKKLRKAMDARGLPYEWLFEEDEGHGFFNEKRAANLLRRIEDFLSRHLAAPSRPEAQEKAAD